MGEQTRQQIAADLEYAIGQLRQNRPLNRHTGPNAVFGPIHDRNDRALDALERIRGYLERGDLPHQQATAGCEHEWHCYGTVNGVPDWGCQLCGATRSDA